MLEKHSRYRPVHIYAPSITAFLSTVVCLSISFWQFISTHSQIQQERMVNQSPQLSKAADLWKLLQIRKKSGTYILDGNSLTIADVVATSLYVNPLVDIDPQRYGSNPSHSTL
jgi:hypothetical protein